MTSKLQKFESSTSLKTSSHNSLSAIIDRNFTRSHDVIIPCRITLIDGLDHIIPVYEEWWSGISHSPNIIENPSFYWSRVQITCAFSSTLAILNHNSGMSKRNSSPSQQSPISIYVLNTKLCLRLKLLLYLPYHSLNTRLSPLSQLHTKYHSLNTFLSPSSLSSNSWLFIRFFPPRSRGHSIYFNVGSISLSAPPSLFVLLYHIDYVFKVSIISSLAKPDLFAVLSTPFKKVHSFEILRNTHKHHLIL